MRYITITKSDVNNGDGCRVTLWFAGCSHHCPGCHNPETWDFMAGREWTPEAAEKLVEELNKPYITGLTLSGGDPVDQLESMCEVCAYVREKCPRKDIWLYTGYTLDQLLEKCPDVHKYVDVVIDGPFVKELRDVSLAYRGSSNQRIRVYSCGMWVDVTEEYDKKPYEA